MEPTSRIFILRSYQFGTTRRRNHRSRLLGKKTYWRIFGRRTQGKSQTDQSLRQFPPSSKHPPNHEGDSFYRTGKINARYPRDLARPEDFSRSRRDANQTHFAIAKMALEAEKHVLVEKPMCLNSRECYELADLGGEKGRVIEVGHLFRFNQALLTAERDGKERKDREDLLR